MPRTTPAQRQLMAESVKRGNNKNLVAKVFGVNVKTVDRWCKRDKKPGPKCFKDEPRKPKESKVTLKVELTILTLRNTFHFGTARIQQGLINLPPYMKIGTPIYVQRVFLSRSAINDVLKKHKINGCEIKTKSWKFFRAKKPNELWQLDIKCPFRVESKKYYFVICIDDNSRYMLLAEQLEHDPTIEEITKMLKPYVKKHKPKNILTDNNPFKDEWDN